MQRTFVTTDTHGCNKQLREALALAKFDYDHDKLIHLGDCTDRGPDSFGVVETLLSIKNLIAVRGNHDDWMLEWFESGTHPASQYLYETYKSYRENCGEGVDITLAVPGTHREFFANQVNYYIDDQRRCFVHAGYDRKKDIYAQPAYMLFWTYDLVRQAMCAHGDQKLTDVNGFKRVFVGHQPTINWRDKQQKPITKPIYAAQVVDCDTGCVYGGALSLIDITDDDNHILYQTFLPDPAA